MQTKRGKFFALGFGEKKKLIDLFPNPDGSRMSTRNMYDILHYRNHSERADEIRKYLIEKMKIKPRVVRL